MSIQLIVIGVALSLLLATACAPILIKKLRILKFGQQIITEYGPTWHKNKQGVPTMGGLIFILSTAVSFLILGIWHYSKGDNFFEEMFFYFVRFDLFLDKVYKCFCNFDQYFVTFFMLFLFYK